MASYNRITWRTEVCSLSMQGNFDFYLVRAIAFNLLHKIVVFRIFLKILFFSRMEILPVIANAVPDLFATIV
jgi:hypothetical protein